MAGYCSLDEFRKMLPEDIARELADDAGLGFPESDAVQEAIDTAKSEIDVFLAVVLDLPLEDPPPLLRKLNQDIGIYNLYSRWVNRIPEARQTRYDDARRLLQMIADGKIKLGVEVDEETPRPLSQASSRAKIFGPDRLGKY